MDHTFDAGADTARRAALQPVLQAFFDRGGTLIDSKTLLVVILSELP